MTPVTSHLPAPPTPDRSSGGRLVDVDGRSIPLRECSLDVRACGGLAAVTLRQVFRNDEDRPLQATYQLPLPPDAAVGGFGFTVGDRRVIGEIDRREAAKQRFEEAILSGRTAGLLEQDRSSLFTQEVGNIPPHTAIVCELELDQMLLWPGDGQWEWRFPTVIAPRYQGEPGRVHDAERVSVDVSERDTPARMELTLRVLDELAEGEPSSPSHRVRIEPDHDDAVLVRFAGDDGVRLDRDIVVRWPVAAEEETVRLSVARAAEDSPIGDAAYGLLTIVPPADPSSRTPIPRDVTLLIDTSGSMMGEPLELVKSVSKRVIESLGDVDRLEMIEFSLEPTRWSTRPELCTNTVRTRALAWIDGLKAGGGTEMQTGLIEALAHPAEDAQRQVILVTDGLVGFESEVVRAALDARAHGCLVHTVGIGSASNRSLTQAVARAGGGAEWVIGLDDDPAAAARRVVAGMAHPIVTGLEIHGSAFLALAGDSAPDLLAQRPALVPIKLQHAGGRLTIRGTTAIGDWHREIDAPAPEPTTGADAVPRLFGRAQCEHHELAAAMGADVDGMIAQLGLDYQISTRMTSWVAVSEEPTVDPRRPIRRVRVPQALPYGSSIEGLGLRREPPMRVFRRSAGNRAFLMRPMGITRTASASEIRECTVDFRQDDDWRASRVTDPLPEGPWLWWAEFIVINGKLIMEFEPDTPIHWELASVEVAGGVDAAIEKDGTTKPGNYGPGDRIRLVVAHVPDLASAIAAHFVVVTLANGMTVSLAPYR